MANNRNDINQSSSLPVVVVMVPFPTQSHMNQLLQLSHIISSYDIPVHYVGSTLHNAQVKSRASRVLNSKKIQFHDFPTPHFHSPPPNDTKFPSHQIPSFQASISLREPAKALLTSLSEKARRVVVIHDLLMSYVVQDATSLPNAEAYIFNPISAATKYAFLRDVMGLKVGNQPEIPVYEGECSAEFESFIAHQFQFATNKKSGHLFNTCRLLESDFLDIVLEKEKETNADMKLWAIGPLETVTIFKNISNFHQQNDCMEWLNKQEPKSVLYVSFGTTIFMKEEQIRELAIGLEHSEVKFLWVLREADKGNIFDEKEVRRPQLPEGYEERVKGKGMVVREWVPQLEILGHSSTGGFLSHCGWNSCLESMSLGVPIAAWPVHTDQPINAAFITNVLKVGIEVRSLAQKDGLVSSSVISEAVKRLMASEEGGEVRKRAEELGFELRKSTVHGGVSHLELTSFVAHVTR